LSKKILFSRIFYKKVTAAFDLLFLKNSLY